MNGSDSDWQLLEKYRKEIDNIDHQILDLLRDRQRIAEHIGDIKKRLGLEIFDPAREKRILEDLASRTDEMLNYETLRAIFNEIISAARFVQLPIKVGFLGPEGTFSHLAVISLFGHSVSLLPLDSIGDVFSSVEKGSCHQGVLPIENSYEGSVNTTLDMLYRYDLKINGEVLIRIRHNLMSKAEDIKEIKRVYSHPMAIAQCRSWIKSHMGNISLHETQSTAMAARMVAEDKEAAVIGNRLLASLYSLNILGEGIEDSPDNITRFLAIGKRALSDPTGKDKTSILFFLRDKAGALFMALEALARKKINMTRIESRPMKTRKWEYLFFVDLEGHEEEPAINEALLEMEDSCVLLKRLGSYPAADKPWE
ncbi:MAG: prephenate dehydratase [Deltaproteobacteria bacterium]|nr:MAG: prephenate dehydratase [Deltaproteobacteria bacterium]